MNQEISNLEVTVSKTYLITLKHDDDFDTESFIKEHLDGITNNNDYFPQLDDEIKIETSSYGTSEVVDVNEFRKFKNKRRLHNALAY